MNKPLGLIITDREGHHLGALVVLDQDGGPQPCGWRDGCLFTAIMAVIPGRNSAQPPQLACGSHLGRIYESIWKSTNPPRLRVVDAASLIRRGGGQS